MSPERIENRRAFLKFLAASPLFASSGAILAQTLAQVPDSVISSPAEALNVLEFEAAARKALPPAHFGYMTTGVDSDVTLKANREGFTHYQLRPRRLVDVSHTDLSTDLFGTKWQTPIFICPVGSQKMFNPEGEIAVAKAARAKNTLQILSTVTTSSVEDVTAARGAPIWYQLYPTNRWEVTTRIVKRAEAAGCPVLVFTVDLMAGRNTETEALFRRIDTRDCKVCHSPEPGSTFRRKPMFDGVDTKGLGVASPAITWDFVRRLKDLTSMKLVLKGIETREDASLCLENGVDGILVSNHGGRAEESGRATIDCLPEVLQAVSGRIPVMVDGGFRRGTDVYKALALGARAVGIGRPYIWGLSAFGQPGVERVLDILHRELDLIMRQCGTPSLKQITAASLIPVH
ncbi:MAG TPA: alpha-hydroxy acid oxidase [Candidatus Acidoferrales bacterium]|nr:alpha-hydroxy acid oxidase [Candidatus Acidoferrales bacterium]